MIIVLYLSFTYQLAIRYLSFCDPILNLSFHGFRLCPEYNLRFTEQLLKLRDWSILYYLAVWSQKKQQRSLACSGLTGSSVTCLSDRNLPEQWLDRRMHPRLSDLTAGPQGYLILDLFVHKLPENNMGLFNIEKGKKRFQLYNSFWKVSYFSLKINEIWI